MNGGGVVVDMGIHRNELDGGVGIDLVGERLLKVQSCWWIVLLSLMLLKN
jgi:hypothetical protein